MLQSPMEQALGFFGKDLPTTTTTLDIKRPEEVYLALDIQHSDARVSQGGYLLFRIFRSQ